MPDNCGIPTPATTLVVQLAPAPIPTLTQSTPESISALVPSEVATLPAMISKSPTAFFIFFTESKTPEECP